MMRSLTTFEDQILSIIEKNPNLSDMKPLLAIVSDAYLYTASGCAVIAIPSKFNGYTNFKLVLLDGWELRRSCANGRFEEYSVPLTSQTLVIEQVDSKIVDRVVDKVNELQEEIGKKHHNNPGFIEALYAHAIDMVIGRNAEVMPTCKCTSDSGRQTGCDSHSISWFLKWAVLEELVQNKVKVTIAKMAYYFDCMNDDNVNNVMTAIQTVVPLLDYLNKEGADIRDDVRKMTQIRMSLERKVHTATSAHANRYMIVQTEPSLPALCIPHSRRTSEEPVSNVRELALKAIGLVKTRPKGENLAGTVAWSQHHPDKLIVAAYIEEIFLERAKDLSNVVEDVECLVKLKDYFKSIVRPYGLELKCEVKSRKLLIEFITVCIVHRRCVDLYPDVASKRVQLSDESLCPAVFKNKQQEDAASAVIAYLKSVNVNKKQYLFSATYIEGTIDFARKYAAECHDMIERLDVEKAAVIRRRQMYWNEVLTKKMEAQELRDTLPGLERDLEVALEVLATASIECKEAKSNYDAGYSAWSSASNLFNACKNYYKNQISRLTISQCEYEDADTEKKRLENVWNRKQAVYNTRSKELGELQNKLENTKKKIAETIKPPKYVVNPLPLSEEDMMVVIFFQMLPRELDLLCLCLFSAQTMLCEKTKISMTDLEKEYFEIVWKMEKCPSPTFIDHYNNYNPFPYSENKSLLVYPEHLEIPRAYGKQCIDDMMDETDSSMWFPAGNFCLMSAALTDPFKCPPFLSKRLYAEPVQPDLQPRFQYVVDYPDEDRESVRGNIVYSKLESLPGGFNETTLINLSSIRAFPDTQMQRLIDCLLPDWLPLGEELVRIVFFVALGQLGKVTSGTVNSRHVKNCWVQLEDRLLNQAERLRITPRNHEEILTLGCAAKFLSSHAGRNKVSKMPSQIAVEWSENVRREHSAALNSARNLYERNKRRC